MLSSARSNTSTASKCCPVLHKSVFGAFLQAECVRRCSGEIGQHARDVVKRKKGVLGRSLASDDDVISITQGEYSAETDNVFSNSDDHTEHEALVITDGF